MIFENEDIMRHIYSFGYPEHRIYMKQLCKEINTDLPDLSNWKQNRINLEIMSTYLKRTYKRVELIELNHKYNKCRCCTRHSYNKPNLLNRELNLRLRQKPYYENICKCNCRHITRHIFKAYWLNF